MSRKNIPLFIPHVGCPHRCIFCDQRAISEHTAFDAAAVEAELARAVATLTPDDEAEIAFFGGSFTAIDRALMCSLLDMAQRYVDAGRVSGIRFSTRPDAISEEVLDALSHYTVNAIELGLQSMDDEVLALCERGHTAAQARDACRRVVAHGYKLVGQMMLGLPASSEQKEWNTAVELCELGVSAVRIYPTVVFDGTVLGNMLKRGDYRPLDSEQAAERAASLIALFESRGVKVLRVGLCASETLASSRVLGGANHPSLGEMAYSALYFRRMCALLKEAGVRQGESACFGVAKGRMSQALGQRRSNVKKLTEQYGLAAVHIRELPTQAGTQISLLLPDGQHEK